MSLIANISKSSPKACGQRSRWSPVERFRDEVHQEFGKVDRRFLHLEARIAVLESR